MHTINTANAFGTLSKTIVATILSALLVAALPAQSFATSSSEHESKAREYADSAAQKGNEANQIKQNIDLLQTHINELTEQYNAALADHKAATEAVDEANRRKEAAEERMHDLQSRLGGRAISMYKSGGSTPIVDVLLGSSSFESFLKSWDAVERIASQDAKWVSDMKDARAEAEEARAEGERQQGIAQQKMDEAKAKSSEIDASKKQLEQTLGQVNEEIARLNALQEEEEMAAEEAKRLEEEAARLAAQKFNVNAVSSASVSREGWTHPCPGARPTSEWGTRVHPISGMVSFHSGIDLAIGEGTPVYAAKNGTVSYVGWYGTGGQAIIVNHGDGVRTVYMHLSGYNTGVGASVSAGQCIGFVGSTGNSTGPHLHFNIEVNSTPINPRSILVF